jgi:hypothetical protein
VLEAEETITYSAAWLPKSRHGKYTAVASLMSENHPMERRVDFELP